MSSMDAKASLDAALSKHAKVFTNLPRKELIQHTVTNRECLTLPNGAIATWTATDCTGRAPKDTYIVDYGESSKKVDWSSPNSNRLPLETFNMLWADALQALSKRERVYVVDRVIGADSSHALPCRVVVPRALHSLFADNMFRAVPSDISRSIYADKGFTLLALPYDRIPTEKYAGKLRSEKGKVIDLALAIDFDRRLGLVYGSSYCGSIKKMMFTVMNFLLPDAGILPLHCSANEANGRTALFLGLSGTGKTTLSSDPSRALIGDDEHSWSDNGISNFENGCYAKLINLNPEKEPEIFHATFHTAPVTEHGAIIENAMVYPDGTYDLNDRRLTENSRVSYPLTSLKNIKPSATGGHPRTVIFLTADANGVLPPVAKLEAPSAMIWFLMGYTSKLAGTETGVTEPSSTFSRFFGGPFMPRHPADYMNLLKKKMEQHGTSVYLVNTGWSGGKYGVGSRMDITLTRRILEAVLNGSLDKVEFTKDSRFHFLVPKNAPGIDGALLDPKNSWKDKDAFEAGAKKLAAEFAAHFDKTFATTTLDPAVKAHCPGK